MPWDKVMGKWKKGKLKSGGSGKRVKSQKQAVAIMLSEKRQAVTKPEYRSSRVTTTYGKNTLKRTRG